MIYRFIHNYFSVFIIIMLMFIAYYIKCECVCVYIGIVGWVLAAPLLSNRISCAMQISMVVVRWNTGSFTSGFCLFLLLHF